MKHSQQHLRDMLFRLEDIFDTLIPTFPEDIRRYEVQEIIDVFLELLKERTDK